MNRLQNTEKLVELMAVPIGNPDRQEWQDI
jgi:hypothetical protein